MTGRMTKALKPKARQSILTVVQGLLLIVILSSTLSLIISILTVFSGVEPRYPSLRIRGIVLYFSLSGLYLIKTLFEVPAKRKVKRIRYLLSTLLYLSCALLFVFRDFLECERTVALLHGIALLLDHILSMIDNHRAHNIIPRVLFCLVLILSREILVMVLLLSLPRIFHYISRIAFFHIRMDVLRKILKKTYAAEILFGLILLLVAFSIVLPNLEPGITDVEDALWYCFSLVTTIGFGDFTAVTVPGRVISVILGIYGIIVVAMITSIIVNFYNETKNSDEDEIRKGREATGDE